MFGGGEHQALAHRLHDDALLAVVGLGVGLPCLAEVVGSQANFPQLIRRADVQRAVRPKAGQKGVGKIPVAALEDDVAGLELVFPQRFAYELRRDERCAPHDAGGPAGRVTDRVEATLLRPARRRE